MELMMMALMLRMSRVHELIGPAGAMVMIELGVDAVRSHVASLREAITPLCCFRIN